jgi:16S rRNA processing protein RimM
VCSLRLSTEATADVKRGKAAEHRGLFAFRIRVSDLHFGAAWLRGRETSMTIGEEQAALRDPQWVPMAQIARSHGVQGEVRLRLFNPESDLLLEVDEVLLELPSGERHEVSVDHARRASDAILMKLYSVDDRDRADSIRGATVLLPRDAFPPLADGEFYHHDLVGLSCFDGETRFGTVTQVQSYPSVVALLVERASGHHVDVPLTEHFVEAVVLPGQGDRPGITLCNTSDLVDEPPKAKGPALASAPGRGPKVPRVMAKPGGADRRDSGQGGKRNGNAEAHASSEKKAPQPSSSASAKTKPRANRGS